MKYQTVLLFGAPGSGKGLQGSIMGRIPGFVHVSCGDVFRNLPVDSPLGKVFLEYSSRGALVPDDFTVQLWAEYIESLCKSGCFVPESNMLILDGIPRNVAQAKLMDEKITVLRLINLDCSNREVMISRLKRRAIHENRLDDANDEVVLNRMKVYDEETAPVLAYYRPEIVRMVETDRTPAEVLTDILCEIRDVVAAQRVAG